MHVTFALIVLITATIAIMTLRYLYQLGAGPFNARRRRVQTMVVVLVLMLSAAFIRGTDIASDSVGAKFQSTIARHLGPIDETVTNRTAANGTAARPFFPARTADDLGSLTTIAGVLGVIVQPAAFPDRATHRMTARGELLGAPATYPSAFGPLTTIRGTAVSLSRLNSNQVFINQTAAKVLGASAGDQLQFLDGGQALTQGPTSLYFAAGNTGLLAAKGQLRVDETLILHNATAFPAMATLTYFIEDDHPRVVTRKLLPHATLHESVNGDVGPNRSVAAFVSSSARITARRLVRLLNAQRAAIDSMSAPGISTPGTTLSFDPVSIAGYTQVSVALANPGALAAHVSATVTSYAGSSAITSMQSMSVPAHGRTTLWLEHPAGRLRVTSDQPIIAEQEKVAGTDDRLDNPNWTITAGVPMDPGALGAHPAPVAGTPAVGVYAPVVRAVLRDQNLVAGGLLSGGAQADPIVVVPLQKLQQLIGQPGQITTVLVSNLGDALAGAPLTGQAIGAVQGLLANTAAATTIKLLLILPRGQDALHALSSDPQLSADTRAKLDGVLAELAVPGTSARLKGLLNDPAVISALRTITDPAVAQTMDPALSEISLYTVEPLKQGALVQATQTGSAIAAGYRDWGRLALEAGILLCAILTLLLPAEDWRDDGVGHRRVAQLLNWSYVYSVAAILLAAILGTNLGSGAVRFVAADVNSDRFATQLQSAARGVGVADGLGELVVAMPRIPHRTSGVAGELTPTPTHTATRTAKPTVMATRTAKPTNTATRTAKPTVMATRTAKPTVVATRTAKPTNTATRTAKPTVVATHVSTRTSTPATTVTVTGAPAITATVTGTPSITATVTGMPSITTTVTGTPSITTTVTGTPSITTTVTGTPSITTTATGTPAITATATLTPDITAMPSSSSTITATVTGTQTSSGAPVAKHTPTATHTPTAKQTPTARHTPTATHTPTAKATPTATNTPTATDTPTASETHTRTGAIAINSGGGSVGSFEADMDVSGGKTSERSNYIDTSGVTNPAPQAVYHTKRFGNFTYTIPNLTPGSRYTVRLHFVENYWKAAGKRIFNVTINSTQVIRDFDVYVAAGGADRAIVKEFTATPGSNGVLRITYASVVDNAESSAIEIIPARAEDRRHAP